MALSCFTTTAVAQSSAHKTLPAVEAAAPVYAIPTSPDRIGRLMARVTVNGRGPFRFMVDTGANHSVISASLLPRLDLSLDRQEHMRVTGIAGSIEASTILIRSLAAGAWGFRNMRLPVLRGPVLDDIDGILGIDQLAHRVLTADFQHDRLSISSGFGSVPIGDIEIPARIVSGGLFEIDSVVGRVPAEAIIDTGSPRTIGNRALLDALSKGYEAGAFGIPTAIVDATETSQSGVLHQVPSLRFGTATMTSFYIAFGDFRVFRTWDLDQRPAIILGMDVLGLFSQITMDYRRDEFGVLPKAEMELYRPGSMRGVD